MFSPDGGKLISGSADNTIRIWDLTAGVQTSVLYHTIVTSLGFSPDGQQIISGSYDRTIRVWDMSTGTPLSELPGHDVSVSSVAYCPDGRQIISGGGDCKVRIWDATLGTNDVLPALESHHGLVTCIAFSPDGRQIVSGSYNGTVIVWDAISGAASFPPLESHMDEVLFVAFSRDGSCVISRSDGGTILYNAASGHQLPNHHPVEEYDNQFSDSIEVNSGYIIDSVTGRTICHLPPIVSGSCYAVHETLLAVGMACGQVSVIHFPPALFTIPDTRAIDRDRMLQGR
jgi:WD40 repeat protein